jgi:hypothetical protein
MFSAEATNTDTDKHKYPIGSGRVTFSSKKSYMKAVQAAFVEIKTPKFTKKVFIHFQMIFRTSSIV